MIAEPAGTAGCGSCPRRRQQCDLRFQVGLVSANCGSRSEARAWSTPVSRP